MVMVIAFIYGFLAIAFTDDLRSRYVLAFCGSFLGILFLIATTDRVVKEGSWHALSDKGTTVVLRSQHSGRKLSTKGSLSDKELKTLVKKDGSSPSIQGTFMPVSGSDEFWVTVTVTTSAGTAKRKAILSTDNLTHPSHFKKGHLSRVDYGTATITYRWFGVPTKTVKQPRVRVTIVPEKVSGRDPESYFKE